MFLECIIWFVIIVFIVAIIAVKALFWFVLIRFLWRKGNKK